MPKNKKKINSYYLCFLSIILLSFLLLFFVALINYKIDPEKVYSNFFNINNSKETYSTEFINKLTKSEYGVSFEENILNERDIKYKLANYPTTAECAVIGSSPVFQISSFRKIKSFNSICNSILNLGVSSSVLEDYLIFSEQLFLNKQAPKKIIIQINPYTLNFNRDDLWQKYSDEYYTFKNKLMKNKESNKIPNNRSYNFLLLENLINLNYLIRSIELFSFDKNQLIIEVKKFDFKKGSEYDVMLPDGSLVYNSNQIEEALKAKIDGITGKGDYKIKEGKWYNQDAIDLLDNLTKYLQQKFEVIFLMTPYHPLVWNISDRPIVKAMKKIEPIIIDIAKNNDVLVYGSFNPKNIPCLGSEYFDEIHLKSSCASKLENFLMRQNN
jgi:hypothetical protein